jgi:hypothetical protein
MADILENRDLDWDWAKIADLRCIDIETFAKYLPPKNTCKYITAHNVDARRFLKLINSPEMIPYKNILLDCSDHVKPISYKKAYYARLFLSAYERHKKRITDAAFVVLPLPEELVMHILSYRFKKLNFIGE